MAAVVIWDQNTLPPADLEGLLHWRRYEQGGTASSIPRYLEDHADRLRKKYLAFIHDLGEYRVGEKSVVDHLDAGDGFSLWWMTLLAEKSPLKSPRIYDCLRLLALEEMLLANRPASLMLVSSDRALVQAISRLCQKLEIHFRSRRSARSSEHRTVLRRIYDAAPGWLQGLIALRHSLRHWPLHRVGAPNWHSAADDVFICSYFIHLDRDRCSRGIFHSRHWELLPKLLHDSGRHVNWVQLFLVSQVVPDVETGITWLESFNRDGAHQGLHVFLESYLTASRVLRALWRWARLVCVKWRLRGIQSGFNVNGSHVWLWPMLSRDWHSSLSGPVALTNCLYLTLFDAALAAMPHQSTGLYLYENQAWEKALLHAWRRHGHGEIIGVAHSTVQFWHLFYFDDPRSLCANGNHPMPLPDLLAVNGKAAWHAFADSGYPREKLIEVEALRYLYLARDPEEGRRRSCRLGARREPGSLRILVVGDMIPASMDNLLTLLDDAVRLMPANHELTLKPHPGYAVDLARFPTLKIATTMRPLSELLDHYDVVLSANSTSAAVDAYVALLPIIVAVDGTGLNLSPLRGRQGAYFVSSAGELVDSLQSVANGAAPDIRQDDFFFLSPDLHRWKRLLARSVAGVPAATAVGTSPSAPLVSVVLPTHNRVDILKRAVESVLCQSVTDFELIIVDDASTDGTKAYLASLELRDPRVRVVHIEKAVGGAGARNAGLQLCRGKWTAFLDDDDRWLPAKLQRQLEKLGANSSAIACSCGYVRCLTSGRSKEIFVPSDATIPGLLADSILGSASLCMCATRILREIDGFDSTLRSAQDMDLWVRLRQKGEIEVCREVLVRYTDHVGPRISSDMSAQYIGSRRFYFKHRYLMDENLRRRRVAYCCFFMSRQPGRSLRHRCYYLLLCVLHSAPRSSLAFARSSAPRLLRDGIGMRVLPSRLRRRKSHGQVRP